MRRMDRYKDEDASTKISRSNKNQDLYQNLGSNTRYTNITDVTNSNAIDITNTNNEYKTREDYQKMRKYSSDTPTPKIKKDLEEFNNIYSKHENRVYDINNVLEEARKNRQEDDLEEKRKLKNTSYNILASLNKDELEKYRQEKKDKVIRDEEGLRELIDTIASKTLAGELEAASDLLSDLMATSIMDKVDKPTKDELPTSIDEKITLEDIEKYKEEVENEEPIKIVIEKEEIVIEKDEEEKEDDEVEEDEDEIQPNHVLNKEEIEEIKKLNEKLAEQQEEENEEPEITQVIEVQKDEDFYTRSMDLSEEDFDLAEEFKDKKTPVIIKVLIILILLVAIAAAIYFFKYKI